MARKKKEKFDFIPSKYQDAIFKYIGGASGHLVVEAAAGSGKTSTLIKSLEYIPLDKQVLMVAFNRDIVSELKKKTKDIENVEVMTLHGLGLSMLKRNFPTKTFIPEPFKYDSHIKNNIKFYTTINTYSLSGRNYYKYLDNIKKYVDFGRFYLCQTAKDLDFIEDRYGIDTIADEKQVAIKVMQWGKTELDSVDYTDMIWMPHVLFLKPIGLLYDFIMVDECQDMNKAERELVLKCFKMGTRLISVGDSNQMLYSFAGGDPDSFNALKSLPNTECLPLSISYRCPKNVVDFAKKLVPSIEANEANANHGFVKYDVPLSDVEDGDMILCRNNAPLVQVYNEFLKLGKKAFIRGKDIGANLKTIVKSVKQEKVNADCKEDGIFVRLYDDLFVTRNKIMERSAVDAKTAMTSPIIENKLDMIKALEILAEGTNTADELIAKIDEIFPRRDKKDGIALSTIHKAKGLEANNVYIACKSLMPSKSAKKDWEIKQEHNLMYVAYTRAKNTLGFIDEKDFKDFDLTNTVSQAKLDRIEAQVNKVLGKTTKTIINESTAKVIVDNAQKLDWRTNIAPAKKTININSGRTVNSFADLFKNKRPIKIKR
jgi:DNA helicase-2/ATP-dependent DNA helicase PcrA